MNIKLINFKRWIAMVAACMFLATAVNAQQEETNDEKTEEALVKSAIDSRNFTFVARSATPLGGRNIMLSSRFDVTLKGDTLHAQLPYYGRAYSAGYGVTDGGFSFKSTDFDYSVKQNKDGGWNILIKPNDTRDVRQLYFSISKNGYASLQVTSNNRQAISYNGIVE